MGSRFELFILWGIIGLCICADTGNTVVRELGDEKQNTEEVSVSMTATSTVSEIVGSPASTALASGTEGTAVAGLPVPLARNKDKEALVYQGKASFYDYRLKSGWTSLGKLVCATRDFSRGTMMLVKNLDNGKTVVCKVTDYGPNKQAHPDRIVDLSSTAFAVIGDLRMGILKNVEIKKYEEQQEG